VEVTCPACGSADVRPVPLIWQGIMSGARPSSDVLAAGLVQARMGRGAARALSREDQESLLADELAPPRKEPDRPVGGSCGQMLAGIVTMLAGVALIVAGVLRIVAKHLTTWQTVTTALGSLVVAAVGYAMFRVGAPKPTFKQYADRLTAWNCMHLCVQCGNRFAQDV
jgi:hypothetical protein